jgi:hypothetical protein
MTHSSHLFSPCEPWPFDPTCCDLPVLDDSLGIDLEALIDRQAQVATDMLWQLTGRKFATGCVQTLQLKPPCRGSCGGSCRLYVGYGGMPLSIEAVTVGGEALDPEEYHWSSPWLCLNRSCKPSCPCTKGCSTCSSPGVICVDVSPGIPLDEQGIAAYSTFVCELVKGCLPIDCGCRLPPGILELSAQGVRMKIADLDGLLRLTGIKEVDDWVRVVNPYHARQPSWLSSPELRQPHVSRR